MTQHKRFFLRLFAAAFLSTAGISAGAAVSASSDGLSASGAISDGLFYSIGGGSVISPPSSRNSMSRLGMTGGWSSDLMCGNFDMKTTVGNQLNGPTSLRRWPKGTVALMRWACAWDEKLNITPPHSRPQVSHTD